MSDSSTSGSERWDSKEEFLDWIDDYCDYAVSSYRDSTAKYPDGSDIQKAQKMRGIQNDLVSGEISFEEALERYDRELHTDSDHHE